MHVQLHAESTRVIPEQHQYSTMLGNDTIFLETEIIHRLVNSLLYFLPIRSPLDKFVHILTCNVSIGNVEVH